MAKRPGSGIYVDEGWNLYSENALSVPLLHFSACIICIFVGICSLLRFSGFPVDRIGVSCYHSVKRLNDLLIVMSKEDTGSS